MAIPLELSVQSLLNLYETAPEMSEPFTKWFPNIDANNGGINISYEVLEYQDGLADIVTWDGPAPARKAPVRDVVQLNAVTLKDKLNLPVSLLRGTRDVNSLNANRAAQVARAVRQLKMYFTKRRQWLMAQWFTGGALLSSAGAVSTTPTGTVYVDYDSQSATSALQSTSLGFRSTHIAATVAANWATAGTDILGDLDTAFATIENDCGATDTPTVAMNKYTYKKTILANTVAAESEWAKLMRAQNGMLIPGLWGYNWEIIDSGYTVRTSKQDGAASFSTGKYIPNNVVVLLAGSNIEAGRGMLECQPSDLRAPDSHRGLFAWSDEEQGHPKAIDAGMEESCIPIIQNTDTMYIFGAVTTT